MNFFLSGLEAFFLVSALSLDAFIASFAYGTNKIKIPFSSTVVINLICSAILGIALVAGKYIALFIPKQVTSYLCFFILLLIAFTKLFDFTIKQWIKKQNNTSPKTEFTLLNFRFCLQLIADPTQADADQSMVLSPKESSFLALSLSLDGLAVGLGAGMVATNHLEIFIFSLITGMIAILLGCWLGNIIAKKTPLNLSWLSGVILLVLAVIKIL